jgi:hypothetical protein
MSVYGAIAGERNDVTQLLISAAEIFITRARNMEFATKNNPATDDIHLNSRNIHMIDGVLHSMKYALQANHDIYNISNKKQGMQYLKKSIKLFSAQVHMDAFTPKRNALIQLKSLIKKGITTSEQLQNFLDISEKMYTTKQYISAEQAFHTFWTFQILAIQLWIVDQTLRENQDIFEAQQLQRIRVNYAHKISTACTNNITQLAVSGARFLFLIRYAINVHLEDSLSDVATLIHYLTLDTTICDTLYSRHQLPQVIPLLQQLKQRIEYLKLQQQQEALPDLDDLMEL